MSATTQLKDRLSGVANVIERVAIVGASGQLGQHITRELVKRNAHTVTALTRKDSASNFPEGVNVVNVDYEDESSLVSALEGQQFLIITLAFSAGNETHNRIVQAAAKAGVSHIMPNIYTTDIVLNNTAFGDEVMIGAVLRPLLSEIDRLGVSSWTILVTSLWYEFSLASPPDWFGFDILKGKVTLFDDGKKRIQTTTWPQSGRAVAALLGLKRTPDNDNDSSVTLQQFENKALYVSSFTINQLDMFDSLKRVTDTTDADWDIQYETAAKRIDDGKAAFAAGDAKGMAKSYYSRVFSPESDLSYEDKIQNTLLGLPEESLDEATAVAVNMVKDGWTPF